MLDDLEDDLELLEY